MSGLRGKSSVRDLVFMAGLFAVVYCGFMCLALSQAKHWTQIVELGRRPPHVARGLRIMGWLLLAVTLAMSAIHDGASFGAVLWTCLLSVGAIAVALTLAWKPNWLRMIAAILRRTGTSTG